MDICSPIDCRLQNLRREKYKMKHLSAEQLFFRITFGIFVVSLVLLGFSPLLWLKQVGGFVVLVYIASTIVMWSSHELLGKFPHEWLVYTIATFIPVVSVALFAPMPYNTIGFIVLFSITGVIGYYWLIAIVISEVKKIGQKIGKESPSKNEQEK
jgi:hypothetical protein